MLRGFGLVFGTKIILSETNTEILDGVSILLLKTRKVQADLESRGTGTTVLGIKQSEF